MDPKVSVSIITYNHERFIAQAIDSALMQRAGFDYEILIGEDDSSDGTREIVRRYKEQYPDKIRLFLNDRKDVIYIDGRPTGRWNLVNNLRHARGEYVAWLEGDDYWTCPQKLQRQVDLMESHRDYAFCFHAVMRCYEDEGGRLKVPISSLSRNTYTIRDLLDRNFVTACSVLFRNGLFGEFPAWYYTVPMGDWPLHILNAEHGNIGYIDEFMAVYRVHSGGIRSSAAPMDKLRSYITLLEAVGQHLGPEYRQTLNNSLARCHLNLALALLRAKKYGEARVCLSNLLLHHDIPKRSVARGAAWTIGRGLGAVQRRAFQAAGQHADSQPLNEKPCRINGH